MLGWLLIWAVLLLLVASVLQLYVALVVVRELPALLTALKDALRPRFGPSGPIK